MDTMKTNENEKTTDHYFFVFQTCVTTTDKYLKNSTSVHSSNILLVLTIFTKSQSISYHSKQNYYVSSSRLN